MGAAAGLGKAKGSKTPPGRVSSRLAQNGQPSSSKKNTSEEIVVPKTKTLAKTTTQSKDSPEMTRIEGTQDETQDDTNSQEKTQADDEDPSSRPDYDGRVVSYTDPDTTRPGTGVVGKYIPGEGYNVQFKFVDDLEPQSSELHCTQDWIEEHLVDAETARAWTTAVSQQNQKEAPPTGKRARGLFFIFHFILFHYQLHS